jgi:hypothetical protein
MTVGIDYRRTDQRTSVLETPFWLTSGEVDGAASEDLAAMLFSFPVASRHIVVHEILVQITTVFAVSAGAVVMTLGTGTIPLETSTTGCTVTDSDVDEMIADGATDVTFATLGYYEPRTGDFATAKAAGLLNDKSVLIVGVAAAVPTVCMYLSNAGGAISSGKLRVHMLISNVPGF